MTPKKASTPSRSRTVTWKDPSIGFETIKAMSGLESLHALKKGQIPPPPFMDLFGIELVEVEEGRVVFELEPEEYHRNWANNVSQDGIRRGGIAIMLDEASSTASGYNVRVDPVEDHIQLELLTNGATNYVITTTPRAPGGVDPGPGSEYRVVPSTDATGHHFDCFIEGVFYGRVTDPGKLEGNGVEHGDIDKLAGVM